MEQEQTKNGEKPRRDLIMPISILIAGLMIAIAVVYNAGKKTDSQAANLSGAAGNLTSPEKMKPISVDDHILGSLDAPVKIVEYTDLECPYCKNFQATLNQVISTYGDKVAIVFRHYPIPQLHPKALNEAQAAECAGKLGGNDKFWAFVEKVFEITPSNNGLDPAQLPKIASGIGLKTEDFNSCLSGDYGKDKIQNDTNDALNSGAEGTPYAIVINNKGQKAVIPGALPFEQVSAIITQALK